MAEDILQDDRAALKLRQPEERPEADRDDIRAVTRQINPALAGLAARAALTDRAKAIFA